MVIQKWSFSTEKAELSKKAHSVANNTEEDLSSTCMESISSEADEEEVHHPRSRPIGRSADEQIVVPRRHDSVDEEEEGNSDSDDGWGKDRPTELKGRGSSEKGIRDNVVQTYEQLSRQNGNDNSVQCEDQEFGKEARSIRNSQEVQKEEYKRLVLRNQAMEERVDEPYEFRDGEPCMYDISGADAATVPSVPSTIGDPERKWQAVPEQVALGIPIQSSEVSSRNNGNTNLIENNGECQQQSANSNSPISPGSHNSDDPLKCRRVVRAPSESLGPVMIDQLKEEEYRKLPSSASNLGSTEVHEQFKLPEPVEGRIVRGSSNAQTGTDATDAYQQIKEEYRRLPRAAAELVKNSAPCDFDEDDRQQSCASESSTIRSDDPYANYNPYQPGAHTIPNSRSRTARPTLERTTQYSSARTNADAYLVSAKLVKEKSQRFQQLEDRQTELEKQINEQKHVLAAHEEILAKMHGTGGSPIPLEAIDSSQHSRRNSAISSLSDSAFPVPTSLVQQATVIATEEDLDNHIAQREERIRQRELELDRLIEKTKRKRKGVKKLKNLLKNPFKKSSSSHGNNSPVTISPTPTSAERSSEVGGRSLDASQIPAPPLVDLSRNESGPTEAATAGSIDHSVGKESYWDNSNNNVEEEEQEKKPSSEEKNGGRRFEKQDSFYVQPEKDAFDGFAVFELKALAKEYNIDISNCIDRIQIVGELTDNDVSPNSKKNDANLRSTFVSEGKKRPDRFIAVEKSPFDGFSIAELKRMAAKAQIDVSHCFDRSEIVTELRNGGLSPKSPRKGGLFGLGSSHGSNHSKNDGFFGLGSSHGSNHSKGDSSTNREDFSLSGRKRSDRFIAPEKDAFDGYRVSELKKIAQEGDVDLTGCIERGQIANRLLKAGVTPRKKYSLFGGVKKGVKYDNDSAPKVVEGKKRAATYAAAPKNDMFGNFSISQLKQIARDTNTDISSCVERGSLCDALTKNGVSPGSSTNRKTSDPKETLSPKSPKKAASPKKSPVRVNIPSLSSSKGPSFDGYSVSQLKAIARESNVDVSTCVERKEIIQRLAKAGIRKESKLTSKDFKSWGVAQLLVLASVINADLSNVDKTCKGEILDEILHFSNVKKPSLRISLRKVSGWGSKSLSDLRKMARQRNVNIAHCVEKEEVLGCLVDAELRY